MLALDVSDFEVHWSGWASNSTYGRPDPMQLRLGFTAGDPFAVHLQFRSDGGPWVPWEISLSLLADGLSYGAGEGDVVITPQPVQRVEIELRSPNGRAYVNVAREPLVEFATRAIGLITEAEASHLAEIELEHVFRAAP